MEAKKRLYLKSLKADDRASWITPYQFSDQVVVDKPRYVINPKRLVINQFATHDGNYVGLPLLGEWDPL